ncbi:MAG: heavy metal-binding domain-containing protein [Propionibacteriaceae bacterium]|jgi:uncharacterized protein YbjQ (UPF0145 family)|nr:heavy metal-binding domain-containing protein [Propionibacteriaceae bacterium]
MLISTTRSVEPYAIAQNLGIVFGITSRARHIGSTMGAGFKAIVGGNIGAFEKLAQETRDEAMGKLVANATAMGADAIVGLNFDTETIGDTMSTVVAYGTAVRLQR